MACRCRRSRSTAAASRSGPAGGGRVRRVLRGAALVTSLGATAASILRRRRARDAAEVRPVGAPEWPPLTEPVEPATSNTSATSTTAAAAFASVAPGPDGAEGLAAWVDPVDGECPLTHPVKGNASSQIYHVPGSRFYDITIPERCYRDEAAAEADGMRAPKR